MDALLKYLPNIIGDKTTAVQPPPATLATVNNSPDYISFLNKLVLTVIIVLIITTIAIILLLWLDQDEQRRNKFKDTFLILFGNNIVLTILIMVAIYFFIPLIFTVFSNLNTVLVEGGKEGLIQGIKGPVSKGLKDVIKLFK